jgi:hypothetical protein
MGQISPVFVLYKGTFDLGLQFQKVAITLDTIMGLLVPSEVVPN